MEFSPNEVLKTFKADMKEAERHQREWFIKREEWISQTYGHPYGNEVSGKSKIVSKDIKKQLEWVLPSITDPFLSSKDIIKCNPVTWEDALSAQQSQVLLNTQFTRKFPRYNFIMKAMKVLATEGTLVVQTGWDYAEQEVEEDVETVIADPVTGMEFISVEKQKVTKVLKNQPTAVVCRNQDIFIDPTCMDDIDKCQFVVHRYESSLSALRADGRYKNLDKVAKANPSLYNDPQYYRADQTYFEFKDEARKKLIVHEYWGNYDLDGDGIAEPIVCAWVNNQIIRLETNPYPDGKPPFIIVPFSPVPFQMFGEALAEHIGDNQQVKTAIIRGFIDNMAKSNNGQVGMRKGALDQTNRVKFLQGKNFEYNGTPNDFYQGSYNHLPPSAFNVLELMNNEIESQTGTKSFSGGINGNSLGATATAARGALDATATRRLNLVRNTSENLIIPLMRKWMSYNAEFLEEEEIVRITNNDFVPIRRDDLSGNIDIEISISTAEDNAAKSQELSFLLQTVGPNEDPIVRRTIMSQIMDLMRMPEQAKQIREYQPQPDPVQQKMQQMQIEQLALQNQKLHAEIRDLIARSNENQIDAQLKLAKMDNEKAKARKLNSDADMMDLDFLKKDSQIDDINNYNNLQANQNAANADKAASMQEKAYAEQLKRDQADRIAAQEMADRQAQREHELKLAEIEASKQQNKGNV